MGHALPTDVAVNMAGKPLTNEQCKQVLDSYNKYGSEYVAARALGIPRTTFQHRLLEARAKVVTPRPDPEPPYIPEQGYLSSAMLELKSRKDNTFLIGACGDQHIASKYHRADVLKNLYYRYEKAGVQAVFNTGNWVDGETSFNRTDLVAHGLDGQCRLLSKVYPKADFPTYAVWGDDHEGWWGQREGVDVGTYAERLMRDNGHKWHNIGFMEAHVRLVNANSGISTVMAVVHPGGGSAYATSYSVQKIIESLEGGEKPAVGLYGHYHKLMAMNVRSVWVAQTGCAQDQTPFMRKKRIEAHVGGMMIHMEQDPKTGAIIGFTPTMWRYFAQGYYDGRWSKHGAVIQPVRTI